MPGVALDAARPRRTSASGPDRPGHGRRAGGRVLRARPGPGVAPRGRDRRDLRDGRRQPAAGRRRGVDGAGPARGADRRSATRAARPGRAADDRPGGDLRRAGALVGRPAAARWRGGDPPPRPVRGRSRGRGRIGLAGRPGPPQHPVPRAAHPDCRAGCPPGRWIGRSHRRAPLRRGDRRATRARARRRRGAGRPSGLGLAGAHRRRPTGRPGPARGARPTRRRDRLSDRRGSTLGRPLGRPRSQPRPGARGPPGPDRTLARRAPARPRRPFRGDHDLEADADPADRRATRPGRRRRRSRLERSGDPADDVRARRCDHHRDGAGGCSRGERPCRVDGLGARLVRGGPGR